MKKEDAIFGIAMTAIVGIALIVIAFVTVSSSYAYTAGRCAAKTRGFQVLEEVKVRVVGGTLTLKRGTVIFCETEEEEKEDKAEKVAK